MGDGGMTCREAGRRGGEQRAKTLGHEGFVEHGRKGGAKVKEAHMKALAFDIAVHSGLISNADAVRCMREAQRRIDEKQR